MSRRPPDSSESADERPDDRVIRSSVAAPAITDPAAPPAEPPTRPPGPVSPDGEPTPRPAEPKQKKGPLAFLRELPALIVIAFLLALLIKAFLVQAFYIPSASMEPTLLIGDRVLVNKLAYKFGDPARGDVIVFENPAPTQEPDRNPLSAAWHWVIEGLGFSAPPDKDFIKRVIGLPGETVEQRGGRIYINGQELDESSWLPPHNDTRDVEPRVVPEGYLFVVGDNRTNSSDSRFSLGTIPMDNVVGKAFVKIWPLSRIGWLRGG